MGRARSMDAQILRITGEWLDATPYSTELRERVERLELIRVDATMCSDIKRVVLIDKQIQHAVKEWTKSIAPR